MKAIERELRKIDKAERKLKQKSLLSFPYKEQLMHHIPDKLQDTLNLAFEKAFKTAFLKGTALLEKTYDKEELQIEHESKQLMVDRKANRKHLKSMDKAAKKSALIHDALSTSSGTVMGFFGLGLPDIPVLVSIILRHLYTCALSYGYDYEEENEKVYLLRLIRESLAEEVDPAESLEIEIKKTAAVLSNRLLVEKFIQGIPVIGAAGGIVNHQIITRISKYAQISYKKRWLLSQIQKVQ